MFRKIAAASLLAVTLAGATLATTGTAEARYGRNGAFAAGAAIGLLGGALLAAPSYGYGYYEPAYYEPACFWKKRRVYDGNGFYHIERVRFCR
jgi:hypothetical protein